MDFEIYNKDNIAVLSTMQARMNHPSLHYLLPLVNSGSKHYTENSDCEFGILKMNNFFLPFSYNEKHPHPTYLTSLRSQFFSYLIEEINKKEKYSFGFKLFAIPLLKIGNLVFRLFGADKIVMINNWLVSTNLVPNFSFLYFRPVVKDLIYEFGEELIIFKGLNDKIHQDKIDELMTIGFIPVVSRLNFVMKGSEKSVKHKRPLEQDKKRWESQSEFTWIIPEELTNEEKDIIINQYKSLYLEKHSKNNPQYNSEFLDAAMKGEFLKIELLKSSDGEIVGVQAVSANDNEVTTPFIGYNQEKPKELGIYRFLNVKLVANATSEGKTLNMSSGAGNFKKQRGGEPMIEYHMIYVDHLPFIRKVFWKLFSKFSLKYIKPILIKNELE